MRSNPPSSDGRASCAGCSVASGRSRPRTDPGSAPWPIRCARPWRPALAQRRSSLEAAALEARLARRGRGRHAPRTPAVARLPAPAAGDGAGDRSASSGSSASSSWRARRSRATSSTSRPSTSLQTTPPATSGTPSTSRTARTAGSARAPRTEDTPTPPAAHAHVAGPDPGHARFAAAHPHPDPGALLPLRGRRRQPWLRVLPGRGPDDRRRHDHDTPPRAARRLRARHVRRGSSARASGPATTPSPSRRWPSTSAASSARAAAVRPASAPAG